jgi:uncharacterized protein with GYD domain
MATGMPSAGINLDLDFGPSNECASSDNLRTEEKMPLFITYASYSNAGIKGIMDKPIDRTEPIRTLVEKAGGKLIAAYMTTGPHDVVIVTEQADGSDAVAVGMAATGSGAVAKIETVRAWTLGEFKGIAEKASRFAEVYVPPGR